MYIMKYINIFLIFICTCLGFKLKRRHTLSMFDHNWYVIGEADKFSINNPKKVIINNSPITVWKDKQNLVGLVIRIEKNPHIRSWTSANESTYYYVNWMQKDGPASRWSNSTIGRLKGYFLRNDLKFVK